MGCSRYTPTLLMPAPVWVEGRLQMVEGWKRKRENHKDPGSNLLETLLSTLLEPIQQYEEEAMTHTRKENVRPKRY